ncbi:nitroreductase [Sphingomonas jinjuensis]|uniref:nitroreductase n=1 Tax=Sphingomonas jinjuensis TaxID=535907 RepID=UPI001621CDF1|nr:nitroreductase [Sphingomonas jinjuensis]
MSIREAVAARRSVRGFLPDPVPLDTLRRIAIEAGRAATGGNLQPWHVDIVTGDALTELKAVMADRVASGGAETPGYAIYPPDLDGPYDERRRAMGELLYNHLGIPREDKAARRDWFARNFQLFGAPAAYFVTVDRRMGPPQWADLGMYLQALMLLAVDVGLATCAQEAWALYPETVAGFLGTPAERLLFCGVAIGLEDPADPANRTRSERAPDHEWLTIRG